ncbi:conjugal transfer protein, partial [Lactobacillus jensenii]|nr:conjugal transfer protein [Lactobacillus jensenii]
EVDKKLANKRIQILFLNKKKELINKYTVKVAFGGFVQYNFDDKLTDGCYMIVKHRQQFSSYKIKIDARTEKTELQPLQSKMPIG